MMMLLVACNSTGVDFPGTGGAGGSAGAGGSGGEPAATSSSSSSSAGGMGGASTASSSSAGGAGGERPDPVCAAPACLTGADGDLVINCDPACGPVHATCKYCSYIPHPVIEQPLQLMLGLNVVRLPPIAEQLFQCGLCDGDQAPVFAMWFRVPPSAACMSATSGAALRLNSPKGPFDTGSWSFMCEGSPPSASSCLSFSMLPGPDRYITVRIPFDSAEQLPDGGSTVRVWLDESPDGCLQPSCPMSCNGEHTP